MLRPYQQAAVDAAINHVKKSKMPAVLEMSVGSGKSFIVAHIAKWINENTGKKTLCLQPSRELTEQNFEKYLLTGNKASIFSASAGSKCTRHPVVYGTPGTVKNSLHRFGDSYGCVLIDECDQTTPTVRHIIERIKEKNPNLRVLGCTGTPYTTMDGFIYQYDLDGNFVEQARDPYYNELIYRITTRELIDMGFLTPAHADPDIAEHYDASRLETNRMGKFNAREVEQVFEGHGRKTAAIVADVVRHSVGRRGVMFFAATVQHAKEIMASLPPDNSRMLGGDVNMKKEERAKLVDDFKAQRFKYVVNVQTLNVGFDAPHVDVIAILRPTESARLLQQIIGRALRLYDGKDDALVLDYSGNIERHNLEHDLFDPEIRVKGRDEPGDPINIKCPTCKYDNDFIARPNPDKFEINDAGNFLDALGCEIETEHGPMPAHYGRRCQGQIEDPAERGLFIRCPHRWSPKECPECGHENDIAARFCESCKAEIVDANEKLREDFYRIKKDPYQLSTDKVLSWDCNRGVSRTGNDMVVCTYTTEYRTFPIYYRPDNPHPSSRHEWESLCGAVFNGRVAPDVDMFMQYLSKGRAPETITYYRIRGSKFYKVLAHNRAEDEITTEY